jgi:hypothetical protein
LSNQWLRLWHDMPTDPKWKTIARASGQPISLVQAIYLHLLVSASRNVTRGHADVTLEDIASALDVTEQEVQSVFDAMQGRVLDKFIITGWDTRQPKKEDAGDASTGAKSAAERKREERARKAEMVGVTQSHDKSRIVTLDKDKEEIKNIEEVPPSRSVKAMGSRLPEDWTLPAEWQEWAEKERPDLEIGATAYGFRDFWIAKAGKDGRKADWQATWRNWVRNQRQQNGRPPAAPPAWAGAR